MRIAFDHQIFGWQRHGGISRYFFEIANRLSTHPRCRVVAVAPLHVNRYLLNRLPTLTIHGRAVPFFPHAGRVLRRLNGPWARRFLALRQPQIVHETYYSSTTVAPRTSKTVLTVFDMIHERFPDFFSPFDPTAREKAAAVQRADHVICISESTRRDLLDITGIPESKTSVVYLGHSLTSSGQSRPHPLAGRPYFLYVGSRRGYKNFQTLLAALGASQTLRRDYRLVAFGGGPLTREETKQMREAGVDPASVIHRQGDDGELSAFYQNAACFVFPSLYEGFGIPPLEAMAHGCPVVCGNRSSLPEVVGDAARLVDPSNPEAFREALEDVLLSPDTRADLVARGRERIKKFSWEKCAAETLNVYERVLQ